MPMMRRAYQSDVEWSQGGLSGRRAVGGRDDLPDTLEGESGPQALRLRSATFLYLVALLCSLSAAGCAAVSNPALKGIPVRLLPDELRGKSVEGSKTIPLNLLGQPQPEAYRIGPNDVLGIWIEGVLGERGQAPPLLPPVQIDTVQLPQAVGFPIQVRLEGTISLPLIEQPLNVQGQTLTEVETAIRRAYVGRQLLQERARIIVSLARPRTFHVLVLREDSPFPSQAIVSAQTTYGSPEYISGSRKGTGWELTLPAYHNDVLTAIAKTGGLPGTDALDSVIIQRNARRGMSWGVVIQDFQAHGIPSAIPGTPIYQIPLRIRPGTPLSIRAEDVTLQDGDVLYIPAREERLFYTGGLLPSGEHILPRDHDLDVLEALARTRSTLLNGNYAASAFTGTLVQPGIGQPSPTLLTVLRKLPHGGQIPIRVDLAKAVRNPRERILVQPGDFLILQETPAQAIVRYTTQMFDYVFILKPFQTGWGLGTAAVSVPGGTAPATVSPIGIGIASPTPAAAPLSGAATTSTSSVAPIGIGVTTPVNTLGSSR
jgi:protein involved in polysaccharide export with SLBB domain